MQIRAILEAAGELLKEGKKAFPEIMIPVTAATTELVHQKAIVDRVYAEVCSKLGLKSIPHLYGTMIEIPRAALTAGRMAEVAEFFSYGTNDLTQMGFGFSRDDIGSFLPDYLTNKILPDDPFQTIDQEGIGELIKIGIERGRATRPKLKVGICGEHGGDATSVKFCHRVGMDYVSCSPFRVPISRLAAAQVAVEEAAAAKKPAARKPAAKAVVKAAARTAPKTVKRRKGPRNLRRRRLRRARRGSRHAPQRIFLRGGPGRRGCDPPLVLDRFPAPGWVSKDDSPAGSTSGSTVAGGQGVRIWLDSTGLCAILPPCLPEMGIGLQCLLEAPFNKPESEFLEIGGRWRIARSLGKFERRHLLVRLQELRCRGSDPEALAARTILAAAFPALRGCVEAGLHDNPPAV